MTFEFSKASSLMRWIVARSTCSSAATGHAAASVIRSAVRRLAALERVVVMRSPRTHPPDSHGAGEPVGWVVYARHAPPLRRGSNRSGCIPPDVASDTDLLRWFLEPLTKRRPNRLSFPQNRRSGSDVSVARIGR